MRSGTYGPGGLDSSSSLELALDQAIAQRFASVQHERAGKKRRHSPTPMMAVRGPRAEQSAAAPTSEQTAPLGSPVQTALTVTSTQTALAVIPSRLSWRGIEVTDEFQLYAARVALGEELAPYRGAVLSRPCSDFPWGSPTSTTVPTPTLPRYPERGRSLRTVLWLGGAVASIIAALGVGAGATSTSKTDNGVGAYDPVQGTAALRPLPTRGNLSAQAQYEAMDGALETSLAAKLAPPSIRASEPPIATAAPEPRVPARLRVPSRPLEALGRVAAPARVNAADPNAVHASVAASEDASRLTIPGDGSLLSSTAPNRSAAPTLPARPPSPSSDQPARDSTLFSDSPSF